MLKAFIVLLATAAFLVLAGIIMVVYGYLYECWRVRKQIGKPNKMHK